MPNNSILISAIICTHNRAKYLSGSLDSLLNQTLAKDSFEVIVVDNASQDNTQQIANSYTNTIHHYSIIKENRLGLSHARNTGLKHAQAEIVAFLDDDAIAKPNWLEKILTAFELNNQIAVVGGKINPIWEDRRPEWLNDNLLPALTIINWSEKPFYIETRSQYVAGANIAFRKLVLIQNGGFDPNLGRIGKKLLSGEEILLVDKIKACGLKVYYDPAIEVDHLVPPSRLNKKWFKDRLFWEGASEAKMNLKTGIKTKISLFYTSFKMLLKSILSFLFSNSAKEKFSKSLDTSYHWGYISALFKLN
jgi:glycosyltransferase involved in cell wall biosynthesis